MGGRSCVPNNWASGLFGDVLEYVEGVVPKWGPIMAIPDLALHRKGRSNAAVNPRPAVRGAGGVAPMRLHQPPHGAHPRRPREGRPGLQLLSTSNLNPPPQIMYQQWPKSGPSRLVWETPGGGTHLDFLQWQAGEGAERDPGPLAR